MRSAEASRGGCNAIATALTCCTSPLGPKRAGDLPATHEPPYGVRAIAVKYRGGGRLRRRLGWRKNALEGSRMADGRSLWGAAMRMRTPGPAGL